jgi:hypothetical protein
MIINRMGLVLTLAARMMCPHGASVIDPAPGRPDLLIEGSPVLLPTDPMMVEGCPNYAEGGTPQPCMMVQWTGYFGTFEEMAVLTQESSGMCLDAGGTPLGPVMIVTTGQSEVSA